MNAEIRNVIFDFGNVIVDLDREGAIRRFAAMGIDVAGLLGTARQKGVFDDLELGRVTADEWAERVLETRVPGTSETGREATVEDVKEAWNSMLTGVPARRLQALTDLKKRYHLALLSNTNEVHIEHSFNRHFRAQGYEPKDMFEHIFVSNEMHVAKPGREIYERVLRESGYKAEETLFIDDCQENCDAFAQLGVRTFCPRWPDEWLGVVCPAVATIGFFDGVHRGHEFLIASLPALPQGGEGLATLEGWREGDRREKGEEGPFADVRNGEAGKAWRRMIVTFAEHPRSVLQCDYVPELLTTPDEKVSLLKATGVDDVEMLHFTPEMSRLTAKQFMEQVLRDRLGVKVLVMGYDHRFGHGGGSLEDYQRWGREVGIEVVKALPLAEENVSSSVIRRLLKEGKVDEAARLLGHAYTLQGRVVSGQQIGHKLGFPTANLQPAAHKLVPCRGVYAVWADVEGGGRYRGMLNIGERPTIDDSTRVTIEVNLLDFEGDLYGRDVTLRFVRRLREEQRFKSREALVAQIQEDEQQVRTLLTEG